MGDSRYSYENRVSANFLDSSTGVSYKSKTDYYRSVGDVAFKQQSLGYAHESMLPKGVKFREARDSSSNPHTVPIYFGMDVTGSMGSIPRMLIKDGLPTMMSKTIQRGIQDPALLFSAIGDHEVDGYPLQVGQFESGDKELDMWLERVFIEGGGGGNEGESYLLAWYFAAFHTITDAWEKRKEKGILITIGDEPNLEYISKSALQEIMGDTVVCQGDGYTAQQLLKAAQEKWDVFHFNILDGSRGIRSEYYWKPILGENLVNILSGKVPETFTDLVYRERKSLATEAPQGEGIINTPSTGDIPIAPDPNIIL